MATTYSTDAPTGGLCTRLAPSFARVVVGGAIHQDSGPKAFGDISNAGVLAVEGYKELLRDDLAQVSGSTAATVAEFTRDTYGAWEFHVRPTTVAPEVSFIPRTWRSGGPARQTAAMPSMPDSAKVGRPSAVVTLVREPFASTRKPSTVPETAFWT